MSQPTCQRWRDRRDSYRPARETIRTSEYDVVRIDEDDTPRAFVERHHYSASYPAARKRFGLYRRGELAGVAVFSHPTNDRVLTGTFPRLATATEAIELGRLVLLDEVAANGESYFVARCFEQLRALRLRGVVSFSDPVARISRDGRVVMPGHVGTVYQALNARYLGRGTPRTLRLLPDGTVLSARTLQKIRAGERGSIAAIAQLESFGAPRFDGESREWVRRIVPLITRPLRHPGNHKYAWSLDRRLALPVQVYSYPKKVAA
jgi:hypothetical protein